RTKNQGRDVPLPSSGGGDHSSLPSGEGRGGGRLRPGSDRKSTRLNSSHVAISYAVFCLKKKNIDDNIGCDRTMKRGHQCHRTVERFIQPFVGGWRADCAYSVSDRVVDVIAVADLGTSRG